MARRSSRRRPASGCLGLLALLGGCVALCPRSDPAPPASQPPPAPYQPRDPALVERDMAAIRAETARVEKAAAQDRQEQSDRAQLQRLEELRGMVNGAALQAEQPPQQDPAYAAQYPAPGYQVYQQVPAQNQRGSYSASYVRSGYSRRRPEDGMPKSVSVRGYVTKDGKRVGPYSRRPQKR